MFAYRPNFDATAVAKAVANNTARFKSEADLAVPQREATCSLSLIGKPGRPGLSTASLSCTGGSITMAASPVLRASLKDTPGVVWVDADACGPLAGLCLLTMCGNSRAHFPQVTVANVSLGKTNFLCFVGTSTALLMSATFTHNAGHVLLATDGNVNLFLFNSTFSGNNGISVFIAGNSTMAVTRCMFNDNIATQEGASGGALRVADGSRGVVSLTTFRNNSVVCDACGGGAMAVLGQATGEVQSICAEEALLNLTYVSDYADAVLLSSHCCSQYHWLQL